MIKNKETTIIFHGIFLNAWHTSLLARFLRKQGYNVKNINYPSTSYNLEDLRDQIIQEIQEDLNSETKLHFIGFSMGGILARSIVNKQRPKNMGPMVQIGTPNHGSEIADCLKETWIYKKLYGPAGQQLTTTKTQEELMGPVTYELGIIAGNQGFNPLGLWLIKEPSDGTVSIQSTKVKGMKEHTLVHTGHIGLPLKKETGEKSLKFIQTGSFL